MKGTLILEISGSSISNSKYAFNTPVEKASIWFDLEADLIEIDGNAIYIDFQQYNINVGVPVIVKILAFSGSDTMDEITSSFEITLDLYDGLFTDSTNNPPTSTSSMPVSSTDISNTETGSSDITKTNPLSTDDNSNPDSKSDGNSISTSNGFEYLVFFAGLLGIFILRRRKVT